MENIIHSGVDWVVNKKFCTDNKLLNIWVHLVTCLSVDTLLHGTGHEIAETLMSDGWWHVLGWVSSDVIWNTDVYSNVINGDSISSDYSSENVPDSSVDTIVSETSKSTDEIVHQSSNNAMREIMLKAKAQALQVVEASGIDGYDPIAWQDFTKMYEIVDAQWLIDHTWHHHTIWDSHAGHNHWDHSWRDHEAHMDHTGHDHEHDGHGILPILWWALVEEYGPTMYKITRQRIKNGIEDLFNLTPSSDTTIIKKSDVAALSNTILSKPNGKVIKYEPNIIADTKQNNKNSSIIPLISRKNIIEKAT